MAALRFVVLRHEGIAEPHFDLMFEIAADSALVTWRSHDWPLQTGSVLTRLADHRRAYLNYEGPISGDRGFVRRVAAGIYQLMNCDERTFDALLSDTNVLIRLRRDQNDQWRQFDTDGNSTRHG